MPTRIMDQSRLSPFVRNSEASSFFSEELRFPPERQVGFWKSESVPDHHGTQELTLVSRNQSVSSSPLNKFHMLGADSVEGLAARNAMKALQNKPLRRRKLDIHFSIPKVFHDLFPFTFYFVFLTHDLLTAIGVSGNGSCPLHGHSYIWNNSNSFHQERPSNMLWSSLSSFMNNIPAHAPSQMNGLPRAPSHMLNSVLPLHHVGSAPQVNPSLWDRRHGYAGDFTDPHSFHPGSVGSMGFSDSPQLHPLELASRGIFPHATGNCIGPSVSPAHVGIPSPQQRCQIFNGRNPIITMPGSLDGPNDRMKSRRNDANSSQADNKKLYELDIERIIRGEDSRTTLMIKNIPNK
ncbi:hypothetical protein B296_00011264 [Ensete ventricosum]|uniref:Mei2-like C-terminal RNA recognition motif domain-containing protein n=1 Tax=Ensete ventricosum TaxID=4639 RepID=A0A427ACP8_ENSVE|nr:hypothetical protein B296_00011264 [Ensete ventricosum]